VFHAFFKTVTLPQDTKVAVRGQIEHIAVPQNNCVQSERCASDVHYHCDVDSKLVTKEIRVHQHKAESSYFCDLCKKSFKSQSYISIQVSEDIIILVMCAQLLLLMCYLKIHMHIQGGESPFSCYVCKKSFRKQNTLNRHLLIHRSECLFADEHSSK
jgi:stress-induced morphogen